jgi:hypothetical protein
MVGEWKNEGKIPRDKRTLYDEHSKKMLFFKAIFALKTKPRKELIMQPKPS